MPGGYSCSLLFCILGTGVGSSLLRLFVYTNAAYPISQKKKRIARQSTLLIAPRIVCFLFQVNFFYSFRDVQ